MTKKLTKSEKDHKLALDKFEADATKISNLNLEGNSHWCDLREQLISPPVCKKVQSSAGCTIGPCNKSTLAGCPVWKSELNAKSAATPKKKKAGGTARNSYQTIMAQVFMADGFATLDHLVETINADPTRQGVKRPADHKNVSVGISILRNPTRVANPLRIEHSRITKLYYYLDSETGKEKYESDMVQVEADKKAKKAAKKEDKPADKPAEKKAAPAPAPAKKVKKSKIMEMNAPASAI